MTDQVVDPHVEQADEYVTFERFLTEHAEQHAEWVDGKVLLIVDNTEHNLFLVFLTWLLRDFLAFKPFGVLMSAGVGMKMPKQPIVRQPDLLFILNEHRDRIKKNYLDGAADIAIEVISPESISRDLGEKFTEYAQAGIPEYWLFDPERDAVMFYRLEQRDNEQVYVRIRPDANGRVYSQLLSGFFFDQVWLDAKHQPSGHAFRQLIDEMVGE